MLSRIFLLLIFIFLPIKLFANSGYYEECYYETADGIKTSVSAWISKEPDNSSFNYHHILTSSPESEQNIWVFKIILPEKNIIDSASSPVEWKEPGWSSKQTKYSSKRTIVPPYWISWPAPDGKDIQPSESVSGFAFKTSYGLPGITDYYAEGDATLPKCPEGMAVDFIPGYHDLTPYGPGIVGKTIGPTAPPADFKLVEFLSYIIDLKHQAASLGWITNKGVENSLDVKLDNAKKKIEAGDTKTAQNILNAFINEVEAQGCETYEKCPEGKHLTPEAYALLKYNVNYLIGQLK